MLKLPNKTRTHKSALFVVALMTMASVLMAQGQSQRAQLLSLDRALADSAYRSGLLPALTRAGTGDLIVLYPGAPVVRGMNEVRSLLSAQPALASLKLAWQPIAGELSPDSTMGATWGVAVVASAGNAPVQIGRYLSAWTRTAAGWKLEAMLLPELGREVTYKPAAGLASEHTPLSASHSPFTGADLAFAKLAADSGAGIAFERFAAAEAEMWSGAGLLIEGPANIGRLVSGPNSWKWYPVAASSSGDGQMGWTVGEAVISTPDGHAGPSKYLTIWRRQRDGSVRYITDGGNGR